MITKPLEEQIADYRAKRRAEKQRRIDRAVAAVDHAVTVLQLVVGTLLAVYAVQCVEYWQRPRGVREVSQ